MASIEITQRNLVVRLHGVDRVLALRSRISVPLGHVVGVREQGAEANFDEAVRDSGRGIGTFVRGCVAAGSVRLLDGRAFYDVHDPRKAIVVDLRSEPFEHLVVQVDGESPDAAARRIREALGRRVAWNDALARTSSRIEEPMIRSLHEPYGVPLWKSTLAVAAGIVFAPVAALAFVFLAPALLPLLVMGLTPPIRPAQRSLAARA